MIRNFCSFEESKLLMDAGLVELKPYASGEAYYMKDGSGPWICSFGWVGKAQVWDLYNLESYDRVTYPGIAHEPTAMACPAVSFAEVAEFIRAWEIIEGNVHYFLDNSEGILAYWVPICLENANAIKRHISNRKYALYAKIGKQLEEYMEKWDQAHRTAESIHDHFRKILKES